MSDRRYKPLRDSMRTQGPSKLADLDGSRKPGNLVRHYATGKIPKQRFKIGDAFEYDGSNWVITYMYRVKNETGVWFYNLEETKTVESQIIGAGFEIIGAGATTPRIVLSEFASHHDATQFFSDIYRHGDSCVKTTQQLLKLKKVN